MLLLRWFFQQQPVQNVDQSPPPAPQQPVLGWEWKYNQNLIGQDQLPTGAQVYDLAPGQRPPEQIQLHAWDAKYNQNLIGKDKLPSGAVLYDLAPGQRPPEQIQLHSWDWKYNQNLIAKDVLPALQRDWPLPGAYPRPDETYSAFYNPNLIGQDKLPTGVQLYDLTQGQKPPPPENLKRWEWFYNLNLIGQDKLPVLNRDWPLPGTYPRLDQFTGASYNKNLIGKDVLPVLQQDWPNPRPVNWYADWYNALALLFAPSAGTPFVQSDWPLPGTYPRLDQFLSAFYNRNLIGLDQLPNNQLDWPLPQGILPWYQHGQQTLLPLFTPPAFAPFWMAGLFCASAVYGQAGHTPINLSGAAAAPTTPPNGYVTEDGTIFYVAEDGTTFYVQES